MSPFPSPPEFPIPSRPKWFIIAAVLGYGGLLALMYVFQRTLMYFPDAAPTLPAQAGLPRAEVVTFRSDDGETLLAWYVPPRDGKPVVLYFQGNAGGLNLRAERFNWLTADGTGLLGAVLSRLWRLERQADRGRADPRRPRGLRLRRRA